MNDKTSIEILKKMLVNHPLTREEREAVRDAIGVLAWTLLSEGRMKNLKRAKEERLRGDD